MTLQYDAETRSYTGTPDGAAGMPFVLGSDIPEAAQYVHQYGWAVGPHLGQDTFGPIRPNADSQYFVRRDENGAISGWSPVQRAEQVEGVGGQWAVNGNWIGNDMVDRWGYTGYAIPQQESQRFLHLVGQERERIRAEREPQRTADSEHAGQRRRWQALGGWGDQQVTGRRGTVLSGQSPATGRSIGGVPQSLGG